MSGSALRAQVTVTVRSELAWADTPCGAAGLVATLKLVLAELDAGRRPQGVVQAAVLVGRHVGRPRCTGRCRTGTAGTRSWCSTWPSVAPQLDPEHEAAAAPPPLVTVTVTPVMALVPSSPGWIEVLPLMPTEEEENICPLVGELMVVLGVVAEAGPAGTTTRATVAAAAAAATRHPFTPSLPWKSWL